MDIQDATEVDRLMNDVKIINANIIDGSGAPSFLGELAIRQGRIAEGGVTVGDAAKTIDAKGLVLAPGFGDVHTHYDAQVFWDKTLSPSCYHGGPRFLAESAMYLSTACGSSMAASTRGSCRESRCVLAGIRSRRPYGGVRPGHVDLQ
ncbi:MAG: hypothetical protein O2780_19435 [Proteobacteria bacterium]|nr:hypothetical protein [Pseudomonadota bacterium]